MAEAAPPAESPWLERTRRLALRTGRGPLRPLWAAVHAAAIRVAAAHLRRAVAGTTVYVRGSFASRQPVFGLSDFDLVAVVPAGAHAAGRAAWEHLTARMPAFGRASRHFAVYDVEELARASSPCRLYGLDDGGAVFLGESALVDEIGLLDRPGLYGPAADWRRVAGRERRLTVDDRNEARLLYAWLELQFWWRYAIQAALEPEAEIVPYLCAKLVAEPARIWLWLEHGERVRTRREALELARRRLPEEEETLALTQQLERRLPQWEDAPLEAVLGFLLRISARIGDRLERDLGTGAATEVSLLGDPSPGPHPLVDWRALAAPTRPEETFTVEPGSPSDPRRLAETARGWAHGRYLALSAGDLLFLPSWQHWGESIFRSVQCRSSDPVPFALLEGRATALFPEARGWSAGDTARRAVAEHAAWLALDRELPTQKYAWWSPEQPVPGARSAKSLGLLLTAARAAVFAASLELGRPELPVTLGSIGESVGTTTAAAAVAEYQLCLAEPHEPDVAVYDAFRREVTGLPGYARPQVSRPQRS